jgi:hypothetical protein
MGSKKKIQTDRTVSTVHAHHGHRATCRETYEQREDHQSHPSGGERGYGRGRHHTRLAFGSNYSGNQFDGVEFGGLKLDETFLLSSSMVRCWRIFSASC